MRRRFTTNNIKPINTDNYMTVVALEDDLVVTATLRPVSYCVDGDGVWVNITKGIETPPIKKGQKISFKQIYNGVIEQAANRFSISKRCNLEGNCNSLVYGDKAIENSRLYVDYAFMSMFSNNPTIIEVSDNFLPALDVSHACYSRMFANCTNLVKAPKLPATAFAGKCYGSMFQNCTSLVTAPELPATTLTPYCYSNMFYGCSSLNHIKMLATDISADGCLDNWVNGVSPTGTFIKNSEATWEVYGDSGIPNGWTVKMDGEEEESEWAVSLNIVANPSVGYTANAEDLAILNKALGIMLKFSDSHNNSFTHENTPPEFDIRINGVRDFDFYISNDEGSYEIFTSFSDGVNFYFGSETVPKNNPVFEKFELIGF